MFFFVFGENLRKLRLDQNLSQKAFGEKVGLSKAVVSKYENGLGFPTLEMLTRIAAYFSVSTDYLLGVSEEKSLSVSGLTGQQIALLQGLIEEFRNSNSKDADAHDS